MSSGFRSISLVAKGGRTRWMPRFFAANVIASMSYNEIIATILLVQEFVLGQFSSLYRSVINSETRFGDFSIVWATSS